MKNSVIFEGGIDKVSTLADGSLRIYVGTPELSNETMVKVFSLIKKPGYVDFDLYYKRQMNKLIDHYKTKLN